MVGRAIGGEVWRGVVDVGGRGICGRGDLRAGARLGERCGGGCDWGARCGGREGDAAGVDGCRRTSDGEEIYGRNASDTAGALKKITRHCLKLRQVMNELVSSQLAGEVLS